ncbi:MAG: hypothetical protein JXA49_06800 [Actinobacteria bacterium]|nr:hypothetical protein [Actinomycetota bacterium]
MAGKLLSRTCPICNTPRLVGGMLKWTNGGTIDLFMGYDLRMVVINPEVFSHIFSSVESMIGMPVDRIIYEAQKNVTKLLFDKTPAYVTGFGLLKRLSFGRRFTVKLFNLLALYTGLCMSETRGYKSGEYGVAYVKNPFNPGLLAANVVGAFEFLEEKPYEYTWKHQESDEFLIEVSASDRDDEISDRFQVELRPIIPGSPVHGSCPKCGVPEYVSRRLRWDLAEGLISEVAAGSRMVFFPSHMLSTAFRELARELGEEIYDLLIDSQSDWTAENLNHLGGPGDNGKKFPEEEKTAVYDNFIKCLPAYGYGNPVSFKRGETVELVVENPYDLYMLGGMLKGVYEGLEKRGCTVGWTKRSDDVVAYELKQA